MNRATAIIIVAIGLLMAGLWAYVNKPNHVPPWPEVIQGMGFSPYRIGQDPAKGPHPTVEQIREDLSLLAGRVHAIRTYSVAGDLAEIPKLADEFGINVTVGLWISDDKEANAREIERFKTYFKEHSKNIVRVVVGNEVLLRKELTEDELIAYIREVKSFVGPRRVGTAETWSDWVEHPKLAQSVDFVAAHILPYWEYIPTDHAEPYVWDRFQALLDTFPDKEVIIGEVGWPSEGRARGEATASLAKQANFLRRFLSRAEQEGITYYILEAFDQVWKDNEGAVGRHWGVYNAERKPKFTFSEPVSPIPAWPQLMLFSLAFALLMLAFMLKDSQGLNYRGRSFLVAISYAVATFVVWLVYDYSHKYLTWQQVIVGIILLMAVLCVLIVIVAEAHEWAESIWTKELRRQPLIKRAKPGQDPNSLPFVSIHLPAYNEPSDMMIETLTALKRLDYPRFEVIIIDNNTPDEATWRSVEAWCAKQDERFRFFHKSPLKGFKAGALNFALSETDSRADIVAVIDSDYIVSPNWLSDLVPLFDRDEIAIVQAPQDYRDGGQNLFKSLCYCEYAGFFNIGMVTRNERNAIIQHGTMTMVRRSVLDGVNGWPEWCITEDAELGLRIFERGYEAVYIPQSYGRGLMPDNFLDFKKQRFRWAYGAVIILRHHMRYLLGLTPSKLSSGQRYHFLAGWLPWVADGLSLVFNFIAIAWSVLMILMPERYMPPEIALAMVPLVFLGFKLLKQFTLYRRRMHASFMQTMAAGLAGLSLSHTVSRAMLAGIFTSKIGFFRTPKNASANGFWRAWSDAREESLLAVLLILCVVVIGQRDDANLFDTQLWMLVLSMQSLPYLAAVLVAFISAFPKLSGRWIQDMPAIGTSYRQDAENMASTADESASTEVEKAASDQAHSKS